MKGIQVKSDHLNRSIEPSVSPLSKKPVFNLMARYNKGMQSGQVTRCARSLAADARR